MLSDELLSDESLLLSDESLLLSEELLSDESLLLSEELLSDESLLLSEELLSDESLLLSEEPLSDELLSLQSDELLSDESELLSDESEPLSDESEPLSDELLLSDEQSLELLSDELLLSLELLSPESRELLSLELPEPLSAAAPGSGAATGSVNGCALIWVTKKIPRAGVVRALVAKLCVVKHKRGLIGGSSLQPGGHLLTHAWVKRGARLLRAVNHELRGTCHRADAACQHAAREHFWWVTQRSGRSQGAPCHECAKIHDARAGGRHYGNY